MTPGHANAIFPPSRCCGCWTFLSGLFRRKYPPDGLYEQIEYGVGKRVKVRQAVTEVAVSIVRCEDAKVSTITSWDARSKPELADLTFSDLCKATTAALPFFPSYPLAIEPDGHEHLYSAGGLAGNNSVSTCYSLARERFGHEKEYVICRIGTGQLKEMQGFGQKMQSGGVIQLGRATFDFMGQARSNLADRNMSRDLKERFFAFDIMLPPHLMPMDRPENIPELVRRTEEALVSGGQLDRELDRLAVMLNEQH